MNIYIHVYIYAEQQQGSVWHDAFKCVAGLTNVNHSFIYVCIYIHTYMYMCVYIHAYIYLSVYACIYVCTCAYIYTFLYIYTNMYIYIYRYWAAAGGV